MATAKEKLLKGTLIYMTGDAVSKLMQFLLLPIITGLLLTEEYGYYDLIISTASLIIPIMTLQVTEAMFKFLFKSTLEEQRTIISTVSVFMLGSIVLLGGVIFTAWEFTEKLQFPFLIFLHYASFTIFICYQKISRGMQKNKAFACSGIIHTFVLIIIQLILLVGFKMRVEALIIANVLANFASILFLEKILAVRKLVSLKEADMSKLKQLLKFSAPLVPNSISWWFVRSINIYIITFFLGVGANGIYSIANKFPQLLTFVTSVFQMAWQESVILESDSKDKSSFFSSIFSLYVKFLLTVFIVALPIIKVGLPFFIDEKFLFGMEIIPILFAGTVFSSLSQFYGVAYLAYDKTKGAVSTTIIAAVINCVITVVLISSVGLFAPALGTMCAYFIQWLYRIFQTRNYFIVHIDWKAFLLYGTVAAFYTLAFYCVENTVIQIGLGLAAMIIFLVTNRSLLRGIAGKVLNMIKKWRVKL